MTRRPSTQYDRRLTVDTGTDYTVIVGHEALTMDGVTYQLAPVALLSGDYRLVLDPVTLRAHVFPEDDPDAY